MTNDSYINYEAIKRDINFGNKKLFFAASVAGILISLNYVRNLNQKVEADEKQIADMMLELKSIREESDNNKQQIQGQIDSLSSVTSTNVENITLLAANTKTKVADVKRSIAAVSKDVEAVTNEVRVVKKKTLSIEERTRAIEQAVDMPGANPLDSLITNYSQE